MSDLKRTVQSLHDELARARQLGPDDRQLLESAVSDIRSALESTPAEATTVEHGDALEGAAVRLEAGHPGLASAIRSVIDALAKAGI